MKSSLNFWKFLNFRFLIQFYELRKNKGKNLPNRGCENQGLEGQFCISKFSFSKRFIMRIYLNLFFSNSLVDSRCLHHAAEKYCQRQKGCN